jgi:hypothetical protein
MRTLVEVLRVLGIIVAALLMIGTGLCSLLFLPSVFREPGLLLLNLAGWGIAVLMFFAIWFLLRKKPGADTATPPNDKGAA